MRHLSHHMEIDEAPALDFIFYVAVELDEIGKETEVFEIDFNASTELPVNPEYAEQIVTSILNDTNAPETDNLDNFKIYLAVENSMKPGPSTTKDKENNLELDEIGKETEVFEIDFNASTELPVNPEYAEQIVTSILNDTNAPETDNLDNFKIYLAVENSVKPGPSTTKDKENNLELDEIGKETEVFEIDFNASTGLPVNPEYAEQIVTSILNDTNAPETDNLDNFKIYLAVKNSMKPGPSTTKNKENNCENIPVPYGINQTTHSMQDKAPVKPEDLRAYPKCRKSEIRDINKHTVKR
ncbi:hypothetical protein FQA39_LY04838 [Lamprigera yunnana]|nr:hypothetical protein FQA39_LY04838 [Lamprigera yunnana]